MAQMTWYVIPTDTTPYLHTFDTDDTTTLRELQTLVGGMIDCVDLGQQTDMWVNDEGLIIGLKFNRFATLMLTKMGAIEPYIVGTAVIAGHDAEGNTLSLPQDLLDGIRPAS